MAKENIKFTFANMAVLDGYFYFIDTTRDLLIQKTSGGGTAFQYPISIPAGFTNYEGQLSTVSCLQQDGYAFWSLQSFTDNSGLLVRKWVITNYLCELVQQYPLINDANFTYDADTFDTEHFVTTLSSDFNVNDTTISLTEFTASAIYEDTSIALGPNSSGQSEYVTVSGVLGGNVVLKTPLTHYYNEGDRAVITPAFYVFNNYAGKDSSLGTLMSFSTTDGLPIHTTFSGTEYKNVEACKFTRLQNVLQEYDDIHTMIFVEGTAARLRDMSDFYRYRAELKVSDDFTGPDSSFPDEEKWYIESGNPRIQNNRLDISSAGFNDDILTSNYNILQDFSVEVSGTVGEFTTYSGVDYNEYFKYIQFKENPGSTTYKFGFSWNNLPLSPVPTDGLVAEWQLNGDALDSSGNDLGGYYVGGTPTPVPGVDGTEGAALDFSGSNRVQIDDDPLLHVADSNADFSVVFWMKITGTASTWWQVTSKSSNTGSTSPYNRTWAIWQYIGRRTLHCRISTATNGNDGCDTVTPMTPGVWHLISYIKEGNNLYVYLDETIDCSKTGMSNVHGNSGPVTIGDSTAYAGFPGAIDNFRIYNRAITEEEISKIYSEKDGVSGGFGGTAGELWARVVSNNSPVDYKVVLSGTLTSGTHSYGAALDYNLQAYREGDQLYFGYRTLVSGIPNSWHLFDPLTVTRGNLLVSLGLEAYAISVDGYFDDMYYTSGYISYPLLETSYLGTLTMDNIQTNQSTIIPIYDLDVYDSDLYRLQLKAKYYGADYSWATYNYQLSPIRPFVDFITADSETKIVPATGRNTISISAVVLDQYGQGVFNKPVIFEDDDSVGYIVQEEVLTESFRGTGQAFSAYNSGTDLRIVTITATATQYD